MIQVNPCILVSWGGGCCTVMGQLWVYSCDVSMSLRVTSWHSGKSYVTVIYEK